MSTNPTPLSRRHYRLVLLLLLLAMSWLSAQAVVAETAPATLFLSSPVSPLRILLPIIEYNPGPATTTQLPWPPIASP